ncbi:hypothetical protein [Psychromonas sp. SP041]|uniref:hypothetical protein n=1 Tax=Psychromonas sp. SP041 TaxID=1365007 RepID=UPI0003FABB39|nr:hypothetical protein [Psychromonas sp. SP041]
MIKICFVSSLSLVLISCASTPPPTPEPTYDKEVSLNNAQEALDGIIALMKQSSNEEIKFPYANRSLEKFCGPPNFRAASINKNLIGESAQDLKRLISNYFLVLHNRHQIVYAGKGFFEGGSEYWFKNYYIVGDGSVGIEQSFSLKINPRKYYNKPCDNRWQTEYRLYEYINIHRLSSGKFIPIKWEVAINKDKKIVNIKDVNRNIKSIEYRMSTAIKNGKTNIDIDNESRNEKQLERERLRAKIAKSKQETENASRNKYLPNTTQNVLNSVSNNTLSLNGGSRVQQQNVQYYSTISKFKMPAGTFQSCGKPFTSMYELEKRFRSECKTRFGSTQTVIQQCAQQSSAKASDTFIEKYRNWFGRSCKLTSEKSTGKSDYEK